MEIETSKDFRLYIIGDDKLIPCNVESICKDGTVFITEGLLPITRCLLLPRTVFKIVKDDEVVFQAKVLKVIDQVVNNVVARTMATGLATTELEAELLCDIEYCQFFEPLIVFPGLNREISTGKD